MYPDNFTEVTPHYSIGAEGRFVAFSPGWVLTQDQR